MYDVMAKKIIAVVRRKGSLGDGELTLTNLYFVVAIWFFIPSQLATFVMATLYYNIDLNEIISLCSKFLLKQYLNAIVEIIFDKYNILFF